jgi:Fe-S-cluster-containing dehydrogenase component
MRLSRRGFLSVAAVVGTQAVARRAVAAPHASEEAGGDVAAVLVDTTLCVGCRSCEAACAEAHGHPEPERMGDDSVFDAARTTSTTHFTVVRRASPDAKGEPGYAKRQCMHCLAPACVSACPVRALEKTPEGPVVYHENRCMGCRYCMVSCPFDVPRYEYENAIPYVRKCDFCAPRLARGEQPACVAACPMGALTFGKRSELLEEAKRRIWTAPDDYVHEVYGEREAGGTAWLYISDRPFETYGLPTDVGDRPYPELPDTALGSVPVILTLGPPILLALHSFSKRRAEVAESGDDKETSHV